MLPDGIRFIRYMNAGTRRFSFWIIFIDDRRHKTSRDWSNGKKEIAKFFKDTMGPAGSTWQFDNADPKKFILKLERDSDATMMVLKFNR